MNQCDQIGTHCIQSTHFGVKYSVIKIDFSKTKNDPPKFQNQNYTPPNSSKNALKMIDII